LFNEGERIKEDHARPKSLNPGFTASASSKSKTVGTGALKDPKEEEAAQASEAAPAVEPKKEQKEKVDPKEKAAAPVETVAPSEPVAKAAI